MKRLISFLLACFLLGSLCACGKEKDSGRRSDGNNSDENINIDTNTENTTEPTESSVENTEPELSYVYVATDRNDDGAIVVYVTDEDGKLVTNNNGDSQTEVRPFEPISREDSVEYFAYKVDLPEGWSVTDVHNRFVNENTGCYVTIIPLPESYEDYYSSQRDFYDMLAAETPDAVSWTEDVYIGEGCTGVVRITLKGSDDASILYFFENSGNLYKILFESDSIEAILNDSIIFCQSISYLPYKYYTPN